MTSVLCTISIVATHIALCQESHKADVWYRVHVSAFTSDNVPSHIYKVPHTSYLLMYGLNLLAMSSDTPSLLVRCMVITNILCGLPCTTEFSHFTQLLNLSDSTIASLSLCGYSSRKWLGDRQVSINEADMNLHLLSLINFTPSGI